ncbi:MAG: N-acetyltransferase [Proteobacteria bacterium]|nr:N-acetyltransferase [Pseudomonadota bacterium]NIS69218.1 N-acetyltransferase [Pseudomonadota bacterium]
MLRKANVKDVKQMQDLIGRFASRGEMIPKSLSELYDQIRDFFVCEEDRTIVGTCALHISWDDLAEIRSLAVEEKYWGKGVGESLVRACIEESKKLGVQRIFALTYRADFFKKLGFKEIDKSMLPHKIWADCLRCVKFPDCDEDALLLVSHGS